MSNAAKLLLSELEAKECWINVYYYNGQTIQGCCYPTTEVRLSGYVKRIYRIHVRLK